MENKYLMYLAVFGITLAALGTLFGWFVIPLVIQDQIHSRMSLQNGSNSYPMWQNLSFPLIFNAYIFNVTNPEAVTNGANPIVKEIGPFCYNLFLQKIILEVNDEKTTIEYLMKRFFEYTQDRPDCLSDKTKVTILNIALMGTVHKILELAPGVLPAFAEAVPYIFQNPTTPFITASAQDILFNGLLLDCSSEEFAPKIVCQSIKGMAPPQVRQHDNGRDYIFSALAYMNGTDEGSFKVETGIKNMSKIGDIIEWKNNSKMDIWPSDECNALGGTDGYIIAPFGEATALRFFQADVCRSIYMKKENTTDIFGIPMQRFIATNDIFDVSPETECFCPRVLDFETEEIEVKCLKNGVMDVSKCIGSPAVMSWPHFYLADIEYLSYVKGLKPSKEKHENYAYIESTTGVPIKGRKRGQINMFLIKSEEIPILQNVSTGLFPILWIEEGAEIPKKYENILKSTFAQFRLIDIIKPVVVLSGVSCFVAAIFLYMRKNHIFCYSDNQIDELTDNEVVMPGSMDNGYYRWNSNIQNINSHYNTLANGQAAKRSEIKFKESNQVSTQNADLFVSHY